MSDHQHDSEDRLLADLLASDPIADDGFSARIVARVRRRMWLRRLAVPVAASIGAAIAYQPMLTIVSFANRFLRTLPVDTAAGSFGSLPSLPVIVAGGALFAMLALVFNLLED